MLLFWRLVRAFMYGKEKSQLGMKKIKLSRMPKLVTVQVLLFHLRQLSRIIWESPEIGEYTLNLMVSHTGHRISQRYKVSRLKYILSHLFWPILANVGGYLICFCDWIGETQMCTMFLGVEKRPKWRSPEFQIVFRLTSLLSWSLDLPNTLLWFVIVKRSIINSLNMAKFRSSECP